MDGCISTRRFNLRTKRYFLSLLPFWHAWTRLLRASLTMMGDAIVLFLQLTHFYVRSGYPFPVPFGELDLLPKAKH
jgi:hypothetical protein